MRDESRVLATMVLSVALLALVVLVHRSCSCSEAHAAQPLTSAGSRTAELVELFTYRDGQLKPSDPRHELVETTARAIDTSAELYGLDPALLVACAYAESSMDPRAVGFSHGETGMLQVHGQARRRCVVAGLDLADPADQIYCGAQWLAHLSTHCGQVVRNRDQCLQTRSPRDCSGGLSAYISGQCTPSKKVAKKVGYRYRLRRWAIRQVDSSSNS